MKSNKFSIIFFMMFLSFSIFSCKKDKGSCYDDGLYQKHKDDMCTMDCPGVIGCDGKTYCNECIANSNGISVKK